jgi:hypothetical protein
MDLRSRAEADLAYSMRDWGVDITLIDPSGVVYDDVRGLSFCDITKFNPDTGQEVVVPTPHIVLRRSTLTRIPQPGETWVVKVPLDPNGEQEDLIFSATRPPEGGRTIGFITLFLQKAVQS